MIKSYTMMMQDEVADRICSRPDVKDYNSLSVAIQYRASAKKVLKISRNIFIPKPNVDSAVIRLDLYDESPYKTIYEEEFFSIYKMTNGPFVNNMKQGNYDKDLILEFIHKKGFNEAVRSEELNVKDFVELTEFIEGK